MRRISRRTLPRARRWPGAGSRWARGWRSSVSRWRDARVAFVSSRTLTHLMNARPLLRLVGVRVIAYIVPHRARRHPDVEVAKTIRSGRGEEQRSAVARQGRQEIAVRRIGR